MSGPQFLHIQSYSLKANPAGQSVVQILGEAARQPEYSAHVDSPTPPKIIYGVTPDEVREKHDEMVKSRTIEVKLANGKTANRGIRKDRHTLLTAVVSYPLLTRQVGEGSPDRMAYDRWIDLNLKWLRDQFGERLASVIEHVDEKHPHLHAFILPLDDPDCMARRLNPAWKAKEEAETQVKTDGQAAKEAVKQGNRAYKAKARELQDDYYEKVGLPAGLTRTGPKRERLSRQQWKARKEAAKREAELLDQMNARVEDLADGQAELEAEAERKAEEIATKLEMAESILEDAERAQQDAEQAARAIIARAEREAEHLNRRVRSELFYRQDRLEAEIQQFAQTRKAFDAEKKQLRMEAFTEAAGVTVRVMLGVLTGRVGLTDDRKRLRIDDPSLAQSVTRLELTAAICKVVAVVELVWHRLTGRLSEAELQAERNRAEQTLKPTVHKRHRGPGLS